MKSSHWGLVLLAVGLVVLVASVLGPGAWKARGQEQLTRPIADLEGKYLQVHIKNHDVNHTLEKVKVVRLFDRDYLTGVIPAVGTEPDAYAGLVQYVSIDDISVIVVFPTLDRLNKAYAESGD